MSYRDAALVFYLTSRGGVVAGEGPVFVGEMHMVTLTRGVDQFVLIGHDIVIAPTDIDEKTVRVVARGRMMGGPNDGGTFQQAHELSRGQSFSIGPCIVVSLIDVKGETARLGVRAPRHLGVCRKEAVQKAKGNDVG